jgi:hypothetical protein
MRTMLPRTHRRALTAALTIAVGLGGVALAGAETAYVDIQSKANQRLDKEFHGDENTGNHLGELPKGEQTLDGVKFKIDDQLIQLGSTRLPNMPEKVEISLNQQAQKLHFLHATGWGQGQEGDEFFVADGTLIGQYQVNYDDKSNEVIPIVYGEDVRDWWLPEGAKDTTTRGKVAWRGANKAAKELNATLRLYRAEWKNPHPGRKIANVLYSSNNTKSAPFLVALTAEK